MKTNQNLIRKMGDFEVTQRTKDGMFNATHLLKQWNEHSGQQKQMVHFLENNSTKEFIEEIANNIQGENQPIPENEGSTKERNSVLLKTRGKTGRTWMHPFLFIDFAMWLNPQFKYQVIKFVYDELIKYRNEAGDAYLEMSSAIGTIVSKAFMPQAMSKVAKALNLIVFGEHESEIRNKKASEDKTRELVDLEQKVTMLINDGYIQTFEGLINQLRKDWKKKYTPKELIS